MITPPPAGTFPIVKKHLKGALPALALLLLLGWAPPALAQSNGEGITAPSDAERIRPGDVVRLTVWREEDLSGEFPVNQFGLVVLPLVGEYDVAEDTQWTLRERVIRDLRESRYNPSIELVVLRRVRVVGEVNEPGVYPLEPTMSIADAVAMAKGRNQWAEEGRVVLRREGEVVNADLRVDERISDARIQSGDEILVPRRSWVDRNLTAIVAGASTVMGILVTLLAR